MHRQNQLRQWLTHTIGTDTFLLKPASADASFRSYQRLYLNNQTLIVMDAPPEHEDCEPFIKVQHLLSKHQIHVPEILAFNPDEGFMLLSDLGSTLYLDVLNYDNANTLYQLAMDELAKIQSIKETSNLPNYDKALLSKEMDLFTDWFIGQHLDYVLSESQLVLLKQTQNQLINSAISQPQVMVHRDYHSRNIMFDDNKAGIIDFQDAVVGPVTYDLASLLKDCYITWPRDSVVLWVRNYLTQYNAKQSTSIKFESFIRWFDLMAAQRHMKAIGIFCRLFYRDGKKQYLNDIPRTLKYLMAFCQLYPEFEDFGTLLDELTPTIKP